MSYKYINPGFAELLNNKDEAKTVFSDTYNPDNGVSFYNTNRTNIFPTWDTKILYIKLDFYMISYSHTRIYNTNNGSTGVGIISETELQIWINDNNVTTLTVPSLLGHHNLILEIKSDSTNGILTVNLDGNQIYSIDSTNIVGGSSLNSNYAQVDSSSVLFSNLIISDESIDLDEKIAICPTKNTVTDWHQLINGIYFPNQSSQQYLENIDMEKLKTNIGSSFETKSLQIVSLPMNGSDNDNSLKAKIIQGSNISEFETLSIINSSNLWMKTNALMINLITNLAWTDSDLTAIQAGFITAKV